MDLLLGRLFCFTDLCVWFLACTIWFYLLQLCGDIRENDTTALLFFLNCLGFVFIRILELPVLVL